MFVKCDSPYKDTELDYNDDEDDEDNEDEEKDDEDEDDGIEDSPHIDTVV